MPSPSERTRRMHLRSAALGFALLLLSVKSAAPQQQPPLASPPAFKFTDVDLDLLEKSNQLDRYMDENGMVYSDPALTEYITALGDDLLPPGPDPEHVIWRFHVLRDPIPNAFALANGSIYVNTGLLALLENEAQLASVLAHEETHVLNRHPYLENRSYRKKSLAANILAGVGAAGGGVGGIGGAAAVLMGTLAPAIVESTIYGYSRELEKEADIRAVAAVNQADYSTEEMINAFKLLESSHEVELSHVFYQDHPKLEDRIGYISDVIHDTRPHTHHPMVEEERYVAATEKASRDNVALDLHAGRERTGVAVAQRLAKQNPKSSEDFRALGDAFRALGPRTPDPTPEELSSKGKRDARKMETKLTDQEYDNALIATPAGKAAMEASQKQSEEAYRKALELDPANAAAHRGLGFLYEKQRLPARCAEEFRKYLELAPNALDQLQIHRRLEAAEKEGASAVTQPVTTNAAPSPKP
jgi:beta-barrel assembly-enhancing protease